MKKFLSNFEEYICAGSLFTMTLIAFANVLSRKLFQASWSFTEEITTNLFILTSMLGAAIAAKRGSHLGLSLITDFFPQKYQRYIALISTLVAVVFSAIMIKYGFEIVQQEFVTKQLTPALGWPEWIFGTFIPIGGIFILIRYVEAAIKAFKIKEVE